MQSSKWFIKRYLEKLPLNLAILLSFFLAALVIFAFIVRSVFLEKETSIDSRIFDFLSSSVIKPGLTRVMKHVTYFASAPFLQIAYCLLLLLYTIRKDFKRVLEIAAIGVSGFLVMYFMKLAFHRHRPPDPLIAPIPNFSFPSGHATSGFIFYGLLVYLIWKTGLSVPLKFITGSLLILFALLIGFSRIYLRVHYPTDVLAGFCVGFSWLFLCTMLMERLKRKSAIE